MKTSDLPSIPQYDKLQSFSTSCHWLVVYPIDWKKVNTIFPSLHSLQKPFYLYQFMQLGRYADL